MAVGDLTDHFAWKMEAAGWVPTGGSTRDPVTVWSRGEGWTATLAVVALPGGGGIGPRRWLMLRADAVDSDDDPRPSRSATAIGR